MDLKVVFAQKKGLQRTLKRWLATLLLILTLSAIFSCHEVPGFSTSTAAVDPWHLQVEVAD